MNNMIIKLTPKTASYIMEKLKTFPKNWKQSQMSIVINIIQHCSQGTITAVIKQEKENSIELSVLSDTKILYQKQELLLKINNKIPQGDQILI